MELGTAKAPFVNLCCYIGASGMQSERFREPVTVYLKHPDGVIRPTPLTTTEEAYKALMKSSDLPVGDPAWQVALDAVVRRAPSTPSPRRSRKADVR